MELLKECKNKRVYALSCGWPMIGKAPQKCKNKRVYALRGGWTIIGIAKKVQR